jgi:hypothetical protein
MSKAEIDAGVHATLQSSHAQNPGHQELVGKAAAALVFPCHEGLSRWRPAW